MAKAKSKAGKKGKVKKPSAPRVRKVIKKAASAQAQAAKAQAYPCLVHVLKGAEKIPVQVKDAAHHQRLQSEFGADHVEVQS